MPYRRPVPRLARLAALLACLVPTALTAAPTAHEAYLQGDWARRQGAWSVAADAARQALEAAPEARAVQRLALETFIATGDIAAAAALDATPKALDSSSATRLALARYARAWRADDPGAALAAARTFPAGGLGSVLGPPLRAWAASAAGADAARRRALAQLADSALDPPLLAYHRSLLALRHDDAPAAWLGFGVLAASDGPLSGRARQRLAALAAGTRPRPARNARAGAVLALRQIAQRLDQFRTGAWPAALYAAARHIQPDRRQLTLAWGRALAGAQRHDLAITAFESILGGNGSAVLQARARLGKARSLIQVERTQAALQTLPKTPAASLPASLRARLWRERGDALHELDRFSAAVAAYDAALAALPAGAEGRRWRLHYRRAWALDLGGDWPAAEDALQQALELAPNQAVLLNYLGYSWANRAVHLDRARKMLEKAAEQRPQASHVVDSLGWVLYRQGAYAQAVDKLEKAARLAPANPVVQAHLGDAYWRAGRKREARFQWRMALDVYDGQGRFDPKATKAKLKRGLPADG